jgi:hypothetical protein
MLHKNYLISFLFLGNSGKLKIKVSALKKPYRETRARSKGFSSFLFLGISRKKSEILGKFAWGSFSRNFSMCTLKKSEEPLEAYSSDPLNALTNW